MINTRLIIITRSDVVQTAESCLDSRIRVAGVRDVGPSW